MPASSLASYADFLNFLLSLGTKLPAAWTIILVIFEKAQELLALFKPAGTIHGGGLQMVKVSPEEAELETQIGAAITAEGSQAIFDGSLLRQLWTFAKANPELLKFLISLLKG